MKRTKLKQQNMCTSIIMEK